MKVDRAMWVPSYRTTMSIVLARDEGTNERKAYIGVVDDVQTLPEDPATAKTVNVGLGAELHLDTLERTCCYLRGAEKIEREK